MKYTIVLDNGITVTTEPQSNDHLTHTYHVPVKNDEQMEEIMSSDAAAHDYGQTHGTALLADA